MNEKILKMSKELLIEGLKQCTISQQLMFKRMYCYKQLDYSIKTAREYSIEQAVEDIKPEYIEHALEQVENTLEKNENKKQNKID